MKIRYQTDLSGSCLLFPWLIVCFILKGFPPLVWCPTFTFLVFAAFPHFVIIITIVYVSLCVLLFGCQFVALPHGLSILLISLSFPCAFSHCFLDLAWFWISACVPWMCLFVSDCYPRGLRARPGQAILVGAGSTKPKTPVRDDLYYKRSNQLFFFLTQTFCFRLCVHHHLALLLHKWTNHMPPTSVKGNS